MTHPTDIRASRAASPDVLIFPSDRAWDAARRGARLTERQRPPAIALPCSLDELVDAVAYATTLGLRVVVTGVHAADDLLSGALLVDPRLLSDLEPVVRRFEAATPAPVAVC